MPPARPTAPVTERHQIRIGPAYRCERDGGAHRRPRPVPDSTNHHAARSNVKMLRLLSALLGTLTLLTLAAAGALLLATEPTALVAAGTPPSVDEARWSGTLAEGPWRRGTPGTGELSLSPRQLDLLLELAARRAAGGHARAALGDGEMEAQVSIPLGWRRGGYANLRLHLEQTAALPRVTRASVGGLPLPASAVGALLDHWVKSIEWAHPPDRITLTPAGARLFFGPGPGDGGALSRPGDDPLRQRLLARQLQLTDIVTARPGRGPLELAELLSALIAAGEDGAGSSADPSADNRAALLVLAAYVNARPLPLAETAPAPPGRTVTLRGRRDLAQHFTASASMATEGGARLSHLVGLAKELRDADGGSGFSFADLMANRAGIRFAALATGPAAGARHVQRLARAGLGDGDIMPAIDGLPEGMRSGALEQRVGAVGSPAYQQLVDFIDRRIDALALHRGAPPSAGR